MAVNIELKRSAVPGKVPTTSSLHLGEIAINTYDGKVYFKKDNGTASIVELQALASGSLVPSSSYSVSSSYALTASYSNTSTSASYALSASYSFNATSASYANTASYAVTTTSASYTLVATSASYTATASSADDFTVRGTLTAQTIIAQYITSSTEFITGSTKFGTQLTNTHQFTGSVNITGSLAINGVDYTSTSASFNTRITNNSASIAALSASFTGFSGSFNTGSFTGSFRGQFTGSFTGSLNNLQGSPTYIPFFSSSQVLANSSMYQVGSASIAINETNITTANPEALYVSQTHPTSINVISGKGNLNNYLQLNIFNTNQGFSASSDIVATANNGNETSNYIDMGINSELYSQNFIGAANDAYLYSTGNDLHIGNATPGKPLQFFVGGTDVDVYNKLQLNSDNRHIMSGSLDVSGSIKAQSFTGSLLGTASYAANANTASYALTASNAVSSSYALTSSYSNNSTSASYALNASNATSASFASTASYVANAQTASYVLNAVSSSFASTASFVANAQTASFVQNAVSASFASTASYVTGSIFTNANSAASASYAANADLLDGKDSTTFATTGSNTFIGNQIVTGSLFTTGSNTLVGNTSLTGSVNISGSTTVDGTTTFRNASTTITGSLLVSGSTTQIGNNTLSGNTTLTGSVTISGSLGTTNPLIRIYGDIQQAGYHRFDPVITNIDTSISASYIYVSGSTNDLYFSQNGSGYNNVTRLRWLESTLYTGILNGGVITSTVGSTTFNISSGSGIIVTQNASTSSAPYPTVQFVTWGNLTNIPITNSGSAKLTYVGLDSTGTPVQQIVPWGSTDINQFDTQINLGVVLHLSGSVSTGVFSAPQIAYGPQQKADDFFRAFGPLKISGHTLQASGSTLSIIKTGGTAFKEGANYRINPNHPSTTVESDILVSKIYRYYISGSTPIIDTGVGAAGYTVIDPTKYNNNGVLSAVAGGNYTIQRVFWIPNSPTNAFIVYYGNATYNSAANAQSAIATEPFTEAPNTAANAIFVAYIIVSGGESNLQNATFIQGGIFRSVGGIGASGTTPVSNTLAGLSDVSIGSRVAGDLLYYNGSQWINSKSLTGNYSITGALATNDGITAVTVTATSFTGSLSGSATFATSASFAQTASYVLNAISSSYAATASVAPLYVLTSQTSSMSVLSASFATTASYAIKAGNASTIDINVFGSPVDSYLLMSNVIGTTGVAIGGDADLRYNSSTNTLTVGNISATSLTGSLLGTASYATQTLTASNANTASYVLNAVSSSFASTASFVQNAVSASFAATASSVNPLLQNVLIGTSTNAGYSLDVNGTSRFQNNMLVTNLMTANTYGLRIYPDWNSSYYGAGPYDALLIDGTNTGNFGLYTGANYNLLKVSSSANNGGNAVFRITNNGTVFINNNTNVLAQGGFPTSSLNSGYTMLDIFVNPSGYPYATLDTDVLAIYGNSLTTYGSTYGAKLRLLRIQGSSREAISVASTGNVGFGVVNPLYNVHISGSVNITGSVFASSFTGSLSGSATNATSASFATTASYVLNAVSASYAATASYADNFTVAGTLTAQTIVAQYVTSSTSFITGSTRFGSLLSNTHQFTGSVSITGSLTSPIITGSLFGTASWANNAITASNANTASYVLNAISSSFASTASFVANAQTASYVLNAVSASFASTSSFVANAQTASYVLQAVSASFATTASYVTGSVYTSANPALSASYAATASFVTNAISASFASTASFVNPLVQNVLITGSLTVSSSNATQLQVGSNLLFISSSGAVGIGTTTPSSSYNLDVIGRSKFGNKDSTYSAVFYGNGSSINLHDPYGPGYNFVLSSDYSYDPFIQMSYGSGLDPLNPTRNNFLEVGNVYLSLKSPSVMSLYTGGTERLRIFSGGNIGIGTTTDAGFKLDVNGTSRFSNNMLVTGSVTATSFTGSLSGSATSALTASYVTTLNQDVTVTGSLGVGGYVTASRFGSGIASPAAPFDARVTTTAIGFLVNNGLQQTSINAYGSNIYDGSGNVLYNNSSGNAIISTTTAKKISLQPNSIETLAVTTGSVAITGSLIVSGSANIVAAVTASTALISGSGTNRFTVIGSGSAQPIFTVQGSQGELFSITDSLSGSLFSVNDISGLPILEVFSDNTTLQGSYLAPALNTTNKVTTTNSGSFYIYGVPTASYDGLFVDYTAKSGSAARAGQFMAIWSGSSVNYTDNSTTDFGNTTALTLTGSISGSNMVITGNVTTGSGWVLKAIIRSI